jgi:hypothetical protein
VLEIAEKLGQKEKGLLQFLNNGQIVLFKEKT